MNNPPQNNEIEQPQGTARKPQENRVENISPTNSNKTQKTTSNIIPDQLNITIRTSIPGFKKIQYKPSMTIKDSHSKGVQFYPLIKLNKSKISKIPGEYRVKQFFSKDLFRSLLINNGGTPAKNLTYATRAGYVDNNIKVTLDTIFPVNSVIYIGNKPYAIGDIQWSSGDWKLELKHKKVDMDLNKKTNPPYGYQGNIKKTSKNRYISKLAYEIVIDMELHPGTSLTPQQINESKCHSKYNAIRKAFSEFTGRPYVIPPVYKTTQTKKNVGGRQKRITRRRH
jgi:hypothetical protein